MSTHTSDSSSTPNQVKVALGIDIGGTGIKGAPVDIATGELLSKRHRIPTPENSTPDAVGAIIAEMVNYFDLPSDAPVGVAFPAPIRHGVIKFIANLDKSWKGVNLEEVVSQAVGRSVSVLNDADAAGYGEALYGAAKEEEGTILVLTLGTGIGSALIVNDTLVPNTEFGHLEMNGGDAEKEASAVSRERNELDWDVWANGPLQQYFSMVDMLLSPDLIVVGGGVSKAHEKWMPLLNVECPIIPAELRNNAGIAGAAAWAAEHIG
ncbi:polyphosphate--glucose phosphotransferase [Rarobacter incanus]|uniref:Polyphosphate glucokinase n=1 Tax=Rarobacter incanus TaxID=153494 RepID=A0A542SMR7_9MICO|nr:ROK family protein [Rarobacter incanus]TQK75868.1 polyphosphate glucokinase [Rarobacter incanus]